MQEARIGEKGLLEEGYAPKNAGSLQLPEKGRKEILSQRFQREQAADTWTFTQWK